jgi:hypothetical protein
MKNCGDGLGSGQCVRSCVDVVVCGANYSM